MSALARHLAQGAGQTVGAWVHRLWSPFPQAALDPHLQAAIHAELALRDDIDADAITAHLAQTGVLCTVHHVAPTSGPTFGAIEQQARLAPQGPLVLFAWAGLPMSNSAQSGALCFGRGDVDELLLPGPIAKAQAAAARDRSRDGTIEGRITLIPSPWRDALVDGCPPSPRLPAVWSALRPALAARLPAPRPDEPYARWALRHNEALARAHTGRDLIFVDLSRVGARAMAAALADPRHPLRGLLAKAGPSLPHVMSNEGGRARSQDPLPADAIEGLRSGALSPGLLPVMILLRCLSRIRLIGGFRQVDYAAALADSIGHVGGEDGLLTGRLMGPEGAPIYPLDLFRGAATMPIIEANTPLEQLWVPMGFASNE